MEEEFSRGRGPCKYKQLVSCKKRSKVRTFLATSKGKNTYFLGGAGAG